MTTVPPTELAGGVMAASKAPPAAKAPPRALRGTGSSSSIDVFAVRAAELLFALRRLEDTAAGPAHHAVGGGGTAISLRAHLEDAIMIISELQTIDDRHRGADVYGESEGLDLEDWTGNAQSASSPPRIADVCFGGKLELKHALRKLTEANAAEGLTIATESGWRKLSHALAAIHSAARQSVELHSIAPESLPFQQAALNSAIAVRRMYARFRRTLRRPAEKTRESVLEALRYAVGGLAILFAAPNYGDVRVSDRLLLRNLHVRALNWAQHDKPHGEGLQLLQDFWICADLLRGISQRQELKCHDARLIGALLNEPSEDVPLLFSQLEQLAGLDDALDALVEGGARGEGARSQALDILRSLAPRP